MAKKKDRTRIIGYRSDKAMVPRVYETIKEKGVDILFGPFGSTLTDYCQYN